MPNLTHIRNVSIISHVDHGKTTLSDHLLGKGGELPRQLIGEARALDKLEEEQRRGITIESSLASLNIKIDDETTMHLNLIDTPGHVDFSGKVAEALRLVDGSIVLVDAVEGIMAQTLTVLRQAMAESITPILIINKVDRLITELEYTEQQIQVRIQELIAQVTKICKELAFEGLKLPNFKNGSVLLVSALHGWGISNQALEKERISMKDIIETYKTGKVHELAERLPLGEVVSKAIYHCLPNPKEAQAIKFPRLFVDPSKVPAEVINSIKECDPNGETYAVNGKMLKIGRSSGFGSLVRILSGKMKRGDRLFSVNLGSWVKVTRVVKMTSRKVMDIKELLAGDVGAVVFSPPLHPGDFLTSNEVENIKLRNISYVQEPIVAISIEPQNIRDVNRLPNVLEEIAEATPGLEFEFDSDTGEMIALGVGMLQLDILKVDLDEIGIKVETSSPMVLSFEMPLHEITFELETWEGITIQAGPSDRFQEDPSDMVLYEDKHNNKLLLGRNYTFSADTLEGVRETFHNAMKVSPTSRQRVKNFTMRISEGINSRSVKSFENGVILTSSAIRSALLKTDAKIHEPYYHVSINIPNEYVGPMIQELQRKEANIVDIENYGQNSIIKTIVHIKNMADAADQFRQLTDGNVFWSYDKVEFRPTYN